MTRSKYFAGLTQAQVTPLEIKVEGPGREHFEDAFRKFKALVQRERIVGQVKERMSYEKPSEKKRRKRREAHERRLLAAMRERLIASGEWEKRQKRKEQRRQQKVRRPSGENNGEEASSG
jgi:small subunit ribosomal protein S21